MTERLRIKDAALEAIADAIHGANPGSPLHTAWQALGKTEGATIAAMALNQHLRAILEDPQTKADVLDGIHLAAEAAFATIIANTISSIIGAAKLAA